MIALTAPTAFLYIQEKQTLVISSQEGIRKETKKPDASISVKLHRRSLEQAQSQFTLFVPGIGALTTYIGNRASYAHAELPKA